MRKKHAEVTDPAEIERILNSATIGRFATNGTDGYPYVTPVNFVFHNGNIYFHCSRKGEKMENLLRDSRVCFQVDIPLAYIGREISPSAGPCKLHQFYHCVIVRGKASVVTDSALKAEALNALVAKHEPSADLPPVTEDMEPVRLCAVVEIKPISVTAKSDLGGNRPEEERGAIAFRLKERRLPGDLDTAVAMGFSSDTEG